IDWGATGVVSLGIGSGTAAGTGIATGTTTGVGIGAGTGIGCTGRAGATTIRSWGTSPSSHSGTGLLYG
ncbi:hypothetical protein KI387_004089, partial [Taxus chinensis]